MSAQFVCTVSIAYAVSFGTASAIVPSFDSTDLKWLSEHILNQDPGPDDLISRTYDRYRKIFMIQADFAKTSKCRYGPVLKASASTQIARKKSRTRLRSTCRPMSSSRRDGRYTLTT